MLQTWRTLQAYTNGTGRIVEEVMIEGVKNTSLNLNVLRDEIGNRLLQVGQFPSKGD